MNEDIDWSITYDLGDWVYLYPPHEIPEKYWDSKSIHYVDEIQKEDQEKWYEVVGIDKDGDLILECYRYKYAVSVDPRWVQGCPEGSLIWVLPKEKILMGTSYGMWTKYIFTRCEHYIEIVEEPTVGPFGPCLRGGDPSGQLGEWPLQWLRPTPFLQPCSKNIPILTAAVKPKGLCPQVFAAGETYSPESIMKAVRDACRGGG